MSDPDDNSSTDAPAGINRRRMLKTLGATAAGFVAVTGTASAARLKFFGCQSACTGTRRSLTVVATDGTFECRRMSPVDSSSDVSWDWQTYCYEAAEDEIVVGFLHKTGFDKDSDANSITCSLCLNPNACAGEAYDSVSDITDALLGEGEVCVDCDGGIEYTDSCMVEAEPASDENTDSGSDDGSTDDGDTGADDGSSDGSSDEGTDSGSDNGSSNDDTTGGNGDDGSSDDGTDSGSDNGSNNDDTTGDNGDDGSSDGGNTDDGTNSGSDGGGNDDSNGSNNDDGNDGSGNDDDEPIPGIDPDDMGDEEDESDSTDDSESDEETSGNSGSDGSTGNNQSSVNSETSSGGDNSSENETSIEDCRKDEEDMTMMERWYAQSDTPDKPGGWEGCQTDESENGTRTAMQRWYGRSSTPDGPVDVVRSLLGNDD